MILYTNLIMNKLYLTGALILGGFMALQAAPLTPDEALSRLANSGPARLKTSLQDLSLVHTAELDGSAVAYIFNKPAQGFMILSADDNAVPVLGYSDTGMFDADNIPPQLQWWLGEYGRQIDYMSRNELKQQPDGPSAYTDPSWEAITPLLTTKWDQGAPYNLYCPTINNRVCPTGCVATSTAQVMNYFKYPEIGTGTISYNVQGVGTLRLNLGDRAFDWDDMLNIYTPGGYTQEEAEAVAYLMQAVGYSVSMGYGPSESGAVSSRIITALKNYFGYDPNMRYISRDGFTAYEWTTLIYDNLKNVGPVIYDGTDPEGGGHSFVCDGYDGAGYFHFNWGWGGVSDGYFTVDTLNPEALGTGGGTGGGFIFSQDLCLGIQLPTGDPVIEQQPFLTAFGAIKVDSYTSKQIVLGQHGSSPLGWINHTPDKIDLQIGVVYENIETGTTQYEQGLLGGYRTISLSSGTYYPYQNGAMTISLKVDIPSDLPDGKYRAIVVTKDAYHPTDEWQELVVKHGFPNYAIVEKDGDNIVASTVDILQPEVTDITMISDVYFQRSLVADVTFINENDTELTYAYSIVLLNEDGIAFRGNASLVTLESEAELTTRMKSKLSRQNGVLPVREPTDFTIGIYNETVGELLTTLGTVTMYPDPGSATVQLRTFAIENANREQEEINGKNQYVYYVPDPSDFTLNVILKITKGYFDSQFVISLSEMSPYNPDETILLDDDIFDVDLFMNADEEFEAAIPIHLPDAQKDVVYIFEAKYALSYSYRKLSSLLFKIGESGVEILDSDTYDDVVYYNLQGNKVVNPQKGELLIERRGDKSRKVIY